MTGRKHNQAARLAEREGNAAETLGDYAAAVHHYTLASREYVNASTAYGRLANRLLWLSAAFGVLVLIAAVVGA